MKILIIGCGGIGSKLVENIRTNIEKGQIDPFIEFTIADSDIVELNQKKYQNFTMDDIGKNKAKVLGKRYEMNSITERIEKQAQLKGYDIFILCVDNSKARKLVVNYCHKKDKEFIDLRASGKKIFAMPKTTLKDNMRFVDDGDFIEYSCQEKTDLDKGWIQLGHEIIASIGCQMLFNHLRGQNNRIIIQFV